MKRSYALGFIGGGNMAEGIVAGVLHAKLRASKEIIVSDPLPERRKLLAEKFSVVTTEDNQAVTQAADTLVLAIKPQIFGDLAPNLARCLASDQLIVSIMAGWSSGSVAKALGGGSIRVVRVMPNLPIRIGAGVAGICGGGHATEEDLELVQRIFEAAGQAVIINREELMDVVTAVSGSGPAYFCYFTEALVEGAVAAGLDHNQALQLAKYTCLGAARMMVETGIDPAELRRQVTSPGGVTQAALQALNWSGVNEAIKHAVVVAMRRGKELGK
jgi:pyrroline-5-carboxylate reductase